MLCSGRLTPLTLTPLFSALTKVYKNKQRTLTFFRMNSYRKHGDGASIPPLIQASQKSPNVSRTPRIPGTLVTPQSRKPTSHEPRRRGITITTLLLPRCSVVKVDLEP